MSEEEIVVFKNILKNYRYYQMQIKELTAQVNYLYSVMSGGTSIKYDGLRYSPVPQQFFNTMEKKDKYEARLTMYKHLVEWCDLVLERLTPKIKRCVIDIYIDNKSFDETAERNNYSKSGLYGRIIRELKRVVV